MDRTCIRITSKFRIRVLRIFIYRSCSLVLLYLLRAAQSFLFFLLQKFVGFLFRNQLSCKIHRKFNSYRISMIFYVSESSFNFLQLSFTMYFQIFFRTVLKTPTLIQTLFFALNLSSRCFI